MPGFLSETTRDTVEIVGLGLAVLQTIIALGMIPGLRSRRLGAPVRSRLAWTGPKGLQTCFRDLAEDLSLPTAVAGIIVAGTFVGSIIGYVWPWFLDLVWATSPAVILEYIGLLYAAGEIHGWVEKHIGGDAAMWRIGVLLVWGLGLFLAVIVLAVFGSEMGKHWYGVFLGVQIVGFVTVSLLAFGALVVESLSEWFTKLFRR